ncbi:hypothetical protein [Neobacillus ginsengisoli]|uniref:N-acetylglutamate synthase-like GNAT family acetyltransferase n=1 Tax=Neobacillus ginsengisoli TaxID=904295 RepID=A0ABT9Y2W6_9BACI|nr:hypothetical protein [Neobacillus ginsengisoli]MDQ0201916.1 N-acetylglutamate synthase-like GNAT family acetyltransferase [Neobacillus ginsengisoli]
MNLKSGQIERFEEYSQFTNLKEFNHHMEMWMAAHNDFTKGELVGLKRLVRFSAKIPGVCNAKIGTVLKAIHDDYNEHGISRSTFKRMTQKAIALGMITVYETERKNGSQSSNLYVFQRFPANEPPKEEKLNRPNETSILSKTNNQKINKRTEEPSVLDYSYVSDRVPQRFVQLVKCFFSEAKTIEAYWRMTQIAAYRNNYEKETGKVLDIAIAGFKQLIRKLKSTQKVKNPIAYFYGVLDKKFEELFVKELFEMED